MEKNTMISCCIGIIIVSIIIAGIGMVERPNDIYNDMNAKKFTTKDFDEFKVDLPTQSNITVNSINENVKCVFCWDDDDIDNAITIEYYHYDNTPPLRSTNHELYFDKDTNEWYAVIIDTTNNRCVYIHCHDNTLLIDVCNSFEFK